MEKLLAVRCEVHGGTVTKNNQLTDEEELQRS